MYSTMDTNKNKPKRFTVHGILGKAIMERASDVFKGKFDSSI